MVGGRKGTYLHYLSNEALALDQREYQERYDKLVVRFETAKARFEEVSELALDKNARENGWKHLLPHSPCKTV